MSLKDKLAKAARPILATAAIMGGAMIGNDSKATETSAPAPAAHETVSAFDPVQMSVKSVSYDGDDKLYGFDLADTFGLKVVTGNEEDALDPEKKYRAPDMPSVIPEALEDGQVSTDQLDKEQADFSGEGTSASALIKLYRAGGVKMIPGTERAVATLSNSATGYTHGTGMGTSTLDKLDGTSFLMESQTDRLCLQRWIQDSMNGIVDQDGGMLAKQEALRSLGHLMIGTMSPMLDKGLPNPDNVRPLTGDTKELSAFFEDMVKRVGNGERVQFKLDELEQVRVPKLPPDLMHVAANRRGR